jgi:hypothetical protein
MRLLLANFESTTILMKTTKLILSYEFDFFLIGLTASVKEYKLAWALNNRLQIDLTKNMDLTIETNNGKLTFLNYLFETEHCIFRLLKNKSIHEGAGTRAFLAPELSHYDFFFLMEGTHGDWSDIHLTSLLREIPQVQLATRIEVDKIKSKENFLF